MSTIDGLKEQASIHKEPETDEQETELVYNENLRPGLPIIGQGESGEWGEFQENPISAIGSSSEDETIKLKLKIDNLETELNELRCLLNSFREDGTSDSSQLHYKCEALDIQQANHDIRISCIEKED